MQVYPFKGEYIFGKIQTLKLDCEKIFTYPKADNNNKQMEFPWGVRAQRVFVHKHPCFKRICYSNSIRFTSGHSLGHSKTQILFIFIHLKMNLLYSWFFYLWKVVQILKQKSPTGPMSFKKF